MKNEIQNLTENEYTELLNTAKAQINAARNAIAVQVNSTANSTYWNLGKLLHEKKIEGGYGGNVINRLSVDLKQSFPDMGLSPRNLWNMKLFYERYIDSDKKLLQAVAVLQWWHNLLLINKKLSNEETFYYATEFVLNSEFTSSDKQFFQKCTWILLKKTFIVRDKDEENRKMFYFVSQILTLSKMSKIMVQQTLQNSKLEVFVTIYENVATEAIASFFYHEPVWKK